MAVLGGLAAALEWKLSPVSPRGHGRAGLLGKWVSKTPPHLASVLSGLPKGWGFVGPGVAGTCRVEKEGSRWLCLDLLPGLVPAGGQAEG